MSSKSKEPVPQLVELTTASKSAGFLSFTIMGLLVVAVMGTMLFGCFLYPYFVGLYLVVPYYTYTLLIRPDELKDGNFWPGFSKNFPLFDPMRKFLGLEILTPLPKELGDAEKKPHAQFVFAVFPHGTYAEYRILMEGVLSDVFPNICEKCRVLAATVLFRIPVVREFALWTGCVDARRSVAQSLLDRGRSVLVLPGGMDEQIRTTNGREIVYLRSRKGFIKLAMKKGVPVVPVYVFGVSDYYKTSHALFGLRLSIMKKLGACVTLATGYKASLLCPRPVKTTIVFGNPVLFKTATKGAPTSDELDAAHFEFMGALTSLFDEHKTRLGYGDRKLEII